MALKEKALKRMAEKLNAAGVTWAVGGDWLMTLRGVKNDWHQFDVVILESDREKADKLLTKMGMRALHQETPVFLCDYHFDGADIAVRADAAFTPADVQEQVTVLGASIPVLSLEAWARISA